MLPGGMDEVIMLEGCLLVTQNPEKIYSNLWMGCMSVCTYTHANTCALVSTSPKIYVRYCIKAKGFVQRGPCFCVECYYHNGYDISQSVNIDIEYIILHRGVI